MKQKHAEKRVKSLFALGFLFALLFAGPGAYAQARRITGVVSDANGPMIGVSVSIQGTTKGVTTGLDGRYEITAEPAQKLQFTFIGYSDVVTEVGQQVEINIEMQEDAIGLDDVVVIGYGTVRKRDLTGSVSSIKEDVILATPTGNVMQALQGRVTGLDFTKNSDGNDVMVMRGNRSIAGKNDPLVIIDGIQGGNYKDVSPADIASIDVLKDASSTAIYGSQGANGVIIITTKSPEKGKMSVTYNAYAGWTMRPDQNTRRVGDSWITPRRTAAKNAGLWSSEADDLNFVFEGNQEAYNAFLRGDWTDYRKLTTQNPFIQHHTVSFSGGSDVTNARFSAGWESEETRKKHGEANRFNLRTVVNHKVNDWLSAGVNVRLAHDYSKQSPYGKDKESDQGWRLGLPFDSAGDIVERPIGTSGDLAYVNPLWDRYYENYVVAKDHSTRISTTGFLDLKPIQGLTLRTQFNANFSFDVKGDYTDKESSGQIKDYNGVSTSNYKMYPKRYLEWNNIATYERSFGDHNFGVTALTAWTKKMDEELTVRGVDQLINTNLWYAMQGAERLYSNTKYTQRQTFSYAGRVNYGYKGRYLLTASFRRDGSSTLPKGKNWDSFPSVALAWRVSDESFMEGASSWLNNLKLRVSYGVTGNSDIEEYATKSNVYSYNDKLALQDKPLLHYDYGTYIGNRETKWERSSSFNVGIDFTLFKGRLDGTIDVYNTDTKDLLLARNLLSSAGADGNFKIMQNIGRTNNKGIEVTLTGYPVRTKDFSWRTTLTFSRNKEKIKDLVDGKDIALSTEIEKKTLMIGRPIKSYRGYNYQGIWSTAEAEEAAKYFKDDAKTQSFVPGDYKIRDLNNDNVISIAGDYSYIGSQTPDWFAGFDHTFRYKNFDMSIYFFFRWGQWGDNPGSELNPETGGDFTRFDKWIFAAGSNENAKLPPLYKGRKAFDYYGYQSVWFCDRSFFKIKNISLGYTLPNSVLSKAKIKNLRVYVSAANPWYHSKSSWMKGIDPERALRNYILGLEFAF